LSALQGAMRKLELRRDDPLLERLRAGDPMLRAAFGGSPTAAADVEAMVQRASRITVDRERLVSRLLEFNRDCGASPATIARIEAIRDPSVLLVATGQQPAFAGGPLYSFYKAAAAIHWAERLTRETGRRFEPIFWLASDDHDVAEVDHCHAITDRLEIRRLRVDWPARHCPIADLLVDDAVLATYAELRSLLGAGIADDRAAHFEPQAGENWTRWIGRIFATEFAAIGLPLFEPAAARDLVTPFLTNELADIGRSPAALRRGVARLEAAGLEAPLAADLPSCLFAVRDGRRQRLMTREFDGAAAATASRAPLSPDAGLRVVMQSAVLPVAMVVGGPGELRYWAQLAELFAAHDVPQPMMVPRPSLFLLTPPLRRALEALEVPLEALLAVEAAFEERLEPAFEASTDRFARERAAVSAAFESLATAIEAVAPGAKPRVTQARGGLEQSLAKLVDRARQEALERSDARLAKARLLEAWLRPKGLLQERLLGPINFLSRLPHDFFSELVVALPEPAFGSHVLEI
jgi:bacillithiol biosynthesis cysteine-adding enzyme BshC